MTATRILVAGIGNIFLGDDAFGVEVVHKLARRTLPEEVRIVDFGIRGMDLVYALLDGYESVILIDAAPRGRPPGTLYVLEPDVADQLPGGAAAPLLEMHSLDPAKVLRLAKFLGGDVQHILLIGCEPFNVDDDVEDLKGMSEPVAAVVDDAVALVETLIVQLLNRPAGRLNRLGCYQTQ